MQGAAFFVSLAIESHQGLLVQLIEFAFGSELEGDGDVRSGLDRELLHQLQPQAVDGLDVQALGISEDALRRLHSRPRRADARRTRALCIPVKCLHLDVEALRSLRIDQQICRIFENAVTHLRCSFARKSDGQHLRRLGPGGDQAQVALAELPGFS